MSAIVVDTHIIVWYFLNSKQLSLQASEAIDLAQTVYVPSISLVELIYLVEKGKLPQIALDRLIQALDQAETHWAVVPLDTNVAQTIARIPRGTIPDMPDRIIAATALYLKVPLVTCDRKILAADIPTIW
ncbi:MAG: type II toxin-antitoxin system VapC family toxin [Thermosynechococcaceae cyanobacterium]